MCHNLKINFGWVWWCTPVLSRLRQEDCKYKVTLGYIERWCLKKLKNKNLCGYHLFLFGST
jgi:hypothetical protein